MRPQPEELGTAARCEGCMRPIKEGGLRYRVRLEIKSDFDGCLVDEDRSGPTAEELIAMMEDEDEGELEAQVFEDLAFIVCPACRAALRRGPLTACARGD